MPILKLEPHPKESTNMLSSQMDGQGLFYMEGGGFQRADQSTTKWGKSRVVLMNQSRN